MKKLIVSAICAGAMMAAGIGGAYADSSAPGTPGASNCHGQTIAFLAQQQGVNGIGNLAKALGISVQQLQQEVDAYCAGNVV